MPFIEHSKRIKQVAVKREAVRQKGAKAIVLRLDMGEGAGFEAFKEKVIHFLDSEWGTKSFDYLVNNAGFLPQAALVENTTEELFGACMRVLFKGPYFLTRSLLPFLADGGSIVDVTTNAIFQQALAQGCAAYASMKGGMTVLTSYMAKEFSDRRIRVNSVAPGATRTRIAMTPMKSTRGLPNIWPA
ncbi:SDR family NAD(P)-dependent oxidoreductase [Pseudomonas sp. TH34]